jgi:hypothetical protein
MGKRNPDEDAWLTVAHEGMMVFDGEELYIVRDGVKIAKRESGKWVSLAPGFTVYDDMEEGSITIEYKAASGRLQ